jgi:hypothetical protein
MGTHASDQAIRTCITADAENAEKYFFVCRETAANENPQSRFQREQRVSLPPQGQVIFVHKLRLSSEQREVEAP